jgi:thymidylate synthase (FAD)
MVKLKSYTQPTIEMILDGVEDMEDLIAYCAKVSNPTAQINKNTSEKLIKYLIKHKHWSPLEMVDATIEIETTRDIAHQIVRHRSFSFQEFSQRYADPNDMGDLFVMSDARLQDTKNRQNSIEIDDPELQMAWYKEQEKVTEAADMAYSWAIKHGIAKEQARKVLPEGLTKTRLYMNGTLRSWLHYIDLRSANGTQKEHMIVARECAIVIARLFPMIWELKP